MREEVRVRGPGIACHAFRALTEYLTFFADIDLPARAPE